MEETITDEELRSLHRAEPLPLERMTREQKIEALYECLTRLWGGGGEYGVYTVAMERERLKQLLPDLLTPPLP